jgi:hypothetical protein
MLFTLIFFNVNYSKLIYELKGFIRVVNYMIFQDLIIFIIDYCHNIKVSFYFPLDKNYQKTLKITYLSIYYFLNSF